MAITVVTGPTIQRAEALSNGVNVTTGKLISIISPAAWSSANLTFQISYDGVAWFDLWRGGKEVVVACGQNRAVLIEPDFQLTGVHVKFRSGTSAAPIAQASVRTFSIAIETP
jgi:hypothetical protein